MAADTMTIREHMEVVCANGKHFGTVDHMDGDEIKLTAGDSPDGKHHFIPSSLVASVDDKVHLSKPGDQVKQMWRSE